VATVYWNLRYGAPVRVELGALDVAAKQTPGNYWDFVRQLVGAFGYLEYRLPNILYSVWFALVAALGLAALAVGSTRGRRAVLIAAAVSICLPIAFWVFLGRAIGSGMSGRQFLPLLVAFPMVCGEIVYRERERLTARAKNAIAALVIAAGAVQFGAWYLNGRRSAVGNDGSLLFPFHAQWTPPLGWTLWLLCAAVGALLLSTVPVRWKRRPRGLAPLDGQATWPIPLGSISRPKSASGHPAVSPSAATPARAEPG
jgi:Predicted membrane protein (DUF2142)